MVSVARGRQHARERDLCGNQSSSTLQFEVCRGVRDVLLSGYGQVYLSEVVSEFEPKTWPRGRDSET